MGTNTKRERAARAVGKAEKAEMVERTRGVVGAPEREAKTEGMVLMVPVLAEPTLAKRVQAEQVVTGEPWTEVTGEPLVTVQAVMMAAARGAAYRVAAVRAPARQAAGCRVAAV